MKQWWSYCFCTCLVFIFACGSIKDFPTTTSFQENNRSSEVDKRLDKDGLIRFLGYRAYKDSLISYHETDSVINPGFILPKTSNDQLFIDGKMQFGNDSVKCIIKYGYLLRYYYTGRSAAFDIINTFWLKKDVPSDSQGRTYHLMRMRVTGTIQCAMFKNEASFVFEEEKNDMDNSTGHLVINNDTFRINPFSKLFPILEKQSLSEKTRKSIAGKAIVGLQLVKDTTVYAMLQRYPQRLYSNDKIALYNKATAAEQIVIAAFFAIVERHW